MNAVAKEVEVAPVDVLEQCLEGLDRAAFEKADAELREADAAIVKAMQNLARLEREAKEAKAARSAWEHTAAQAALEGSTPKPYEGPSVEDAARMFAVGSDTVAAMKTAAQQAVHRRAVAREKLRVTVNTRLVQAYVALAEQLVLVHQALEAARDPNENAALYTPHWRNLIIPTPRGMQVNDDGSLWNFFNLDPLRKTAHAILRGAAPEIIK